MTYQCEILYPKSSRYNISLVIHLHSHFSKLKHWLIHTADCGGVFGYVFSVVECHYSSWHECLRFLLDIYWCPQLKTSQWFFFPPTLYEHTGFIAMELPGIGPWCHEMLFRVLWLFVTVAFGAVEHQRSSVVCAPLDENIFIVSNLKIHGWSHRSKSSSRAKVI